MMIRFIYTLLLTLISPLLLWGLYRKRANKPAIGSRWREHFGDVLPCGEAPSLQPIWLHAVSVGEVLAAKPVILGLLQRHPQHHLLVTTTTPTGAAEVAKLQQQLRTQTSEWSERLHHRYAPLDFPWAVRRFLTRIQPTALLIMETELWPNLLTLTAQQQIPITVLNARLSERSKQRYQKFPRLFALIQLPLTRVLCQHHADAERFLTLGLSAQQVAVTGSIKFDIEIDQRCHEQAKRLHAELGERPIWIAASTHEGEEEQIIQAHQQLLAQQPNALLIVVPRHPERFELVANLIKQSRLSYCRRSAQQLPTMATQVYLADTMGELLMLFAVADIAFLGGSLAGPKKGGHNLLEPAALAKPLLTGPSFYNFQTITETLIAEQACLICDNSAHLALQLLTLFQQPQQRRQMGQAALNVVAKNKGAVTRTLDQLVLTNP